MMVEHAVQYVSFDKPVRFFEPSAGTGVFFSALMENPILGGRTSSMLGLEIDPDYAQAAQVLWKGTGVEIRQDDFITFSSRPEKRGVANLICTNPPYVRHHHLSAGIKEVLKARIHGELGIEVSGLTGLYVYFILLAHSVLMDEGVASWLIPSEFLVVNYGRALREYLTSKVELISIHQFDPEEVQFDDALVSSCIVTYRKRTPLPDAKFTFGFGGGIFSPRWKRDVPTGGNAFNGAWRLSPHESSTNSAHSIGDLFTIRRGIATGANAFFMLLPEQALSLEIPRQFLRPVLPSPKLLSDPVIKADEAGLPLVDGFKFLIDCSEPPEVVKRYYPKLWSYFERGRAEGVADGFLCANREPWYAQEQRVPAPFLASYMGRATRLTDNPIRFFRNHSKAIVTNVLLNLYPKPWLKQLLDDDPARGDELIELLNSISASVLKHGGRAYGGGLHKVEPSELSRMPLPELPSWAVIPAADQLLLL